MQNHAHLYAVATALILAPTAVSLDTETDFESINSTDFFVGTAQFSGDAFSGVAGIGELYRSGNHAWMVNPGGTGVIDFGATNASTVEFWTRIRTGANGSSVYTVFDDSDQVIDTLTIDTPGAFQFVSFTGDIDRIELVNNATGNNQMNSIDDFGFNAVPEPGSLALLGVASLVALRRRR